MNKKIGALITALCMTSGMAYADVDALYEGDEMATIESSAQSHFPDYIMDSDNTDPVSIRSVCPIWKSREQTSMEVTVEFVDQGVDKYMWAPDVSNPPSSPDTGAGVVDKHPDWSLVGVQKNQNSFNMKWIFMADPSRPVKSITLDGLAVPDDDNVVTIFDIIHGPEVTPGSMTGYPFTVTADAAFVADADAGTAVEATYSRPVVLGGGPVPPNHDLYGVLTIDFVPEGSNHAGFTGTAELDGFMFRADTDCAMEADLGSFSTEVRGGQVQIEWTTLSERGTDGFEVMKGHDTLCAMPSLGDEGHGETYVCIDSNGSAGDRYTLVEIETDGKVAPLASERAQ